MNLINQLIEKQLNPDLNWMDNAKCRDIPQFLELAYNDKSTLQKEAIKTCQQCSVRIDCLNYSIHAKELYGVWGGYTAQDRLKKARQLQRILNTIPPFDTI